MDVAKFKVAELKRELKIRGLSTVGNKQDLIDRLLEVMDGSGDNSLVMDDDGNVEEGLGDDDDDDDDDEDALCEESAILGTPTLSGTQSSISTTMSTPTTESSLLSSPMTSDDQKSNFKRAASKVDSKIPSKKIVLNRTNLPAVEKENLDGKDSKDGSASSDDGLSKTVKLAKVELTAKERLELRAKKFGVSVADTAKADERAARFGLKDTSSKAAMAAPALDLLKKRADRFGTSVSSVMEQAEMEERKRRRQERFGISEAAVAVTKTVATSTTKGVTSGSDSTTRPITANVKTSIASSKRVPIMAPSGSAPADSTTDNKKKLRAERFKIK